MVEFLSVFCITILFLICGYHDFQLLTQTISICFRLIVIQFKHILKNLHFLLLSPTFCDFNVLFTSSCLSFCCSFIITFTVFFFFFYLYTDWFTFQLWFPVSSCFFSIQRRPFSISFQIGLGLLYSFTFCLSEKLFLLLF